MKWIVLFMSLILSSSCCFRTQKTKITKINEILIYDYFWTGGYTTAGAASQLSRLEKANIAKIKLEPSITDSLSHIMKEAKVRRLFQSKTGMSLLFGEIITADNQVLKIYISRNVICDYTNKQEYWIKNPEHLKWVSEFIDKMYSTKNSISEQHL